MSEKKGLLGMLGIDKIFENIKKLIDTRLQIIKLEIKEEISKSLSNIIFSLIILNVALFSILFLSIGLSIYIGSLLENYYYGFLIIGGFYLALLLLLILMKDNKWLKDQIELKLNQAFGINE